jgi:hypothetical protein
MPFNLAGLPLAAQVAVPVRAMVPERPMVPASPGINGDDPGYGEVSGDNSPRIIPGAGIIPAHSRLPGTGTH